MVARRHIVDGRPWYVDAYFRSWFRSLSIDEEDRRFDRNKHLQNLGKSKGGS